MNWMSWQIDFLLLLQNFRDLSGHILDGFFLNITMFGEVIIPLFFIISIYWCVNKKAGIYILWNYMFGFLSNLFLKTTACIYRPWIIDSRIEPLQEAIPAATGYSFPSGHTAGAVSTWGGAAVVFWNNKFIRYLCITIVVLVMFSRNYVGVHTPQDVIVSFLVSVLILWGTKKLLNWLESVQNRDLLTVCIISVISIIVLFYVNLKSYPSDCFGGKLLFDPTPVKINSFARTGLILGVFWGWLVEKRFVEFTPETGTILQKIVRVLAGSIILYLLSIFKTDLTGILFIQHLVIGLFITLFYPLIIKYLQKKF